MSNTDEAHDDMDILPSPLQSSTPRRHRRSESEINTGFKRPPSSPASAHLFSDTSPRWGGMPPQIFTGGGAALPKQRSSTAVGLFGAGARLRFNSTSSPSRPSRQNSVQASRQGRQGWKATDITNAEEEGPKLVSLSDLIRKEDKVPATFYEHSGENDFISYSSADMGGLPQQAFNAGAVGWQDALKAAEHGDSVRLSKFLQDGGDPLTTVSRLHHMRWTLLHLAAGCAMMGGRRSFAYRSRPEPDCNDGYATCVSELLAAGADPNVVSKHGGYTPLMGAALTRSKECCCLLLRAGAQPDRKAEDGRSAYDFAQQAKHVAGSAEAVTAVLRDPPRKVPRSPLAVRATLANLACVDSEDAAPAVEVRWRVPSQESLLPAYCGEIERYYVKCWHRGKGREVVRTKTSTSDVPRRDFCRNQTIDRGIALRKNLCLPQSLMASAIVHGLQAGETYSFTVSCVAQIEGALRHSPPSCMSKPFFVPDSKDAHNFLHLSGMLSIVTGNNSPSPTAEAGITASQQNYSNNVSAYKRRARGDQAAGVPDQRGDRTKSCSISWAKEDSGLDTPRSVEKIKDDGDDSPTVGFGRSVPVGALWESRLGISQSPTRQRSQSYAISSRTAEDIAGTGLAAGMLSQRHSSGGEHESKTTSVPITSSGPPTKGIGSYYNQPSAQATSSFSLQATRQGSRGSRITRTHGFDRVNSDYVQEEGCTIA